MNVCVDVVVPARTVRCFANNKPGVMQEVKAVLNRKKLAFRSRNKEEKREAQQEFRLCLKEAKEAYKRKLENQLGNNQVREVWSGMKTISAYSSGIVWQRGTKSKPPNSTTSSTGSGPPPPLLPPPPCPPTPFSPLDPSLS